LPKQSRFWLINSHCSTHLPPDDNNFSNFQQPLARLGFYCAVLGRMRLSKSVRVRQSSSCL
jgi:hypothetical protein